MTVTQVSGATVMKRRLHGCSLQFSPQRGGNRSRPCHRTGRLMLPERKCLVFVRRAGENGTGLGPFRKTSGPS